MRVVMMSSAGSNETSPADHLMQNLVEDILGSGHSVTYIVDAPTRPDSPSLANKLKPHPNLDVIKIPRWSMGRKNNFFRFFDELWLTLNCVGETRRCTCVDVVFIPSSPTYGIAVILISLLTRKPVVHNLQDLFPDVAINSGQVSKRLAGFFRIIEKWSYRRSALMTVIGEDMRDNLLKKGVPAEKIVLMPNWIDTDAVTFVPADRNRFLQKYGLSPELFYVVYAGNMGWAQDLEVVLRAASLLRDRKQIQFLLVGDGKMRVGLERMASELSLDNVQFFPFEPQDMVPDVYSAGNVCLVSLRPGIIGNSVPSKTCAIMACARPVLACVDEDSTFSHLIKSNELGLVVPASDHEGLARAIETLCDSPELTERLGRNGCRYVNEHLSRKASTEKYIRLFESLLQ